MDKDNWRTIPDDCIRHTWTKAPDDTCKEEPDTAQVSPDWYEENGTPMCPCGEDMVYSHTEIRIPSSQTEERADQVSAAAAILASATILGDAFDWGSGKRTSFAGLSQEAQDVIVDSVLGCNDGQPMSDAVREEIRRWAESPDHDEPEPNT